MKKKAGRQAPIRETVRQAEPCLGCTLYMHLLEVTVCHMPQQNSHPNTEHCYGSSTHLSVRWSVSMRPDRCIRLRLGQVPSVTTRPKPAFPSSLLLLHHPCMCHTLLLTCNAHATYMQLKGNLQAAHVQHMPSTKPSGKLCRCCNGGQMLSKQAASTVPAATEGCSCCCGHCDTREELRDEPVDVDDTAGNQGVVALVLTRELVALPLGAPLLCFLTAPCHTTHLRLQLREMDVRLEVRICTVHTLRVLPDCIVCCTLTPTCDLGLNRYRIRDSTRSLRVASCV